MMGVGIWAMHFVGMLAYVLPIPVAYDIVPTALSVVPAIFAAAVALHVVARPAGQHAPPVHRRHPDGRRHRGHALWRHGGDERQCSRALRSHAVRHVPRGGRGPVDPGVAAPFLGRPGSRRGTSLTLAAPSTARAVYCSPGDRQCADPGLCRDGDALHRDGIDLLFRLPRGASHFFLDARLFAGVTRDCQPVPADGDRRCRFRPSHEDRDRHAPASRRNVAAEMERLNSVFQASGAGILMLDRDTRVILANQHVLDILRKTAATSSGCPMARL